MQKTSPLRFVRLAHIHTPLNIHLYHSCTCLAITQMWTMLKKCIGSFWYGRFWAVSLPVHLETTQMLTGSYRWDRVKWYPCLKWKQICKYAVWQVCCPQVITSKGTASFSALSWITGTLLMFWRTCGSTLVWCILDLWHTVNEFDYLLRFLGVCFNFIGFGFHKYVPTESPFSSVHNLIYKLGK